MVQYVDDLCKQRGLDLPADVSLVQTQVRALIDRSPHVVAPLGDRVSAPWRQPVEAGQGHATAVGEAPADIDSGTQPAAQISVDCVALVVVGRELLLQITIAEDIASVGVRNPSVEPIGCPPLDINLHTPGIS